MSVVSALVIASAALSAGSSIASARGQRRAAGEVVKEGNRLAADATARGEEEVTRYGIQLDQMLGRQRAVMGASNIDMTVGSAAQVTAETERFGAMDVAQIRENAQREAFGLKRQAQAQASQLRAGATAAYAQAGATLLSAGARGWELYQQGKTFAQTAATTVTRRAVAGMAGTVDRGLVSRASGWGP